MGIAGKLSVSDLKIIIINIYLPHQPSVKLHLWSILIELISSHQDSCVCVIGDFNCVRNKEERINCLYRAADSQAFNEFILDNELIDVKVCNSLFTWCGRRNKLSRLDRALINWHWASQGNWEINTLDRKNSDHRAILLKSCSRNWGPKPFKFFDCWLEDANLINIISKDWEERVELDFMGK